MAFIDEICLENCEKITNSKLYSYRAKMHTATKKIQYFVKKLSELEKKIQLARQAKTEIYSKIDVTQSDLKTRKSMYKTRLSNMKRDPRMLTSLCIMNYLSDESLSKSGISYYLSRVPRSLISNSVETCLIKQNITHHLALINRHEEKLLEV